MTPVVLALVQIAGVATAERAPGPAVDAWAELDREIASLAADSTAQTPGEPRIGGFLRVDQLWSDTENADAELGTQLANARISLTGRIGDIDYVVSLDGATGSNGTTAGLEDAYAIVPLTENLRLSCGRYVAPFLFTATVGDDRLVFWERTFQGETWAGRDEGLQLLGDFGHVRVWANAQNGGDGVGDDLMWNVDAAWDLNAGRALGGQEGGYGVDAPVDVTAALAFLDEGTLGDGGVVAGQLIAVAGGFYLASEVVGYGDAFTPNAVAGGIAQKAARDDLGGSTGWDLTAAYQLTEQWELALRFQDVGVDDTRSFSIGLNWFVAGWGAQWLADFTHVASDDPAQAKDEVLVGLVLGF